MLQAVLVRLDGSECLARIAPRGLTARDLAMSVVLPEIDGRVLTRAVGFKSASERSVATQSDIIALQPVPDRVAFVARQAAAWARLRHTARGQRRIALLLANYPNKDARLANGVGLDTPASLAVVVEALADAGYSVGAAPRDGRALMDLLRAGPTNAQRRASGIRLDLDAFRRCFEELPAELRAAMVERWGSPEEDPTFLDGAFHLALHRFGNMVVGIQPARGYNIDPKATYHDPALVPPHGYLAFYAWLRQSFDAQALVHLGKHGNLEWLPGKALALDAGSWPEAVMGALPHLYPFIVNDPGEGSQAKRRTSAVIIDHLTPPLTRAEAHGRSRDLEALVDEYYDASGQDPRRLELLAKEILELISLDGLGEDAGIDETDAPEDALVKLDAYLCELKELQIRDGLHVFGKSPEGRLEADLLAALARLPRPGAASLTTALAMDLALDIDPLDAEMARPWSGPRPAVLDDLCSEPWRSEGDTVERLELLAASLIDGSREPPGLASRAVMENVEQDLRPALRASGAAEIEALLAGLDGRFVPPGPSGAPTRGRPDVLPTGRNFYSVDNRAVPTPAAWRLGWASACRLLERYRQDHGRWPARIGLSAWGTANMRTGGDDIAQALALMGVQPTWETASRRLIGFEIMPLSVLDRPRVDVTFRVSGFFRDAFPMQMDLVDSAARAVMALDESPRMNPLAARFREECDRLIADGTDTEAAKRRAGHRVFGSMPGAYGAGLQALMDEGAWTDKSELADAYLAWGSFAYGGGREGVAAREELEERLGRLDAVLQNQDNREHDILDSDDYYQFQGGMTVTAEALSGERPVVLMGDHSRPESPRIRSLEEEIGRVVRARVVNPKWIRGVMRHGFKGAFEMSATVDYLFAYAATTGAVRDHHFDLVYDAYLADEEVRDFLEDANPDALVAIAEKLTEAMERGLWKPRRNSTGQILNAIEKGQAA